jgi:hypothetical protein
MNIIDARRDKITVGDKPLDAIEAEWREWEPAHALTADVVPHGWVTSAQYAEIVKCGRATATRRLAIAAKKGEIEVRNFRTLKSNGTPQTVAHYRLKG